MTVEDCAADQPQLTCMSHARQHVKRELWSYFALAGLFFLYLGILIVVYAVKGVFDAGAAMTFCGVFLAGAGAVNLIVSCVFYRHHRHHQPISCLGDKEEVAPAPDKPKEVPRLQTPTLPAFLTPEFAKYAEFSARDRNYEGKKYLLKLYEPTQFTISFAHRYWSEQQQPLLSAMSQNPSAVHPAPPSIPRSLLAFTSGRSPSRPASVGSAGLVGNVGDVGDVSSVWSPGRVVHSTSGTDHNGSSQALQSPGQIIGRHCSTPTAGQTNGNGSLRSFEQVISKTAAQLSASTSGGSPFRSNDLSKASAASDRVKDGLPPKSGNVNAVSGPDKTRSGAAAHSSEPAGKRASVRSTGQTNVRTSFGSAEQASYKRASVRSSEQAGNRASVRSTGQATERASAGSSGKTSQSPLQRQTSKSSDRT